MDGGREGFGGRTCGLHGCGVPSEPPSPPFLVCPINTPAGCPAPRLIDGAPTPRRIGRVWMCGWLSVNHTRSRSPANRRPLLALRWRASSTAATDPTSTPDPRCHGAKKPRTALVQPPTSAASAPGESTTTAAAVASLSLLSLPGMVLCWGPKDGCRPTGTSLSLARRLLRSQEALRLFVHLQSM